jgi:hypothetical protein
MKKLARVEVRWNKKTDRWEVVSKEGVRPFVTKELAVRCGIQIAQAQQPSQLRICLMNGTYREERTYPRSRDPRRSKG